MAHMLEGLANCLHDLTAIGPGGVLAVAPALFLAGLAGGFTHCAGMCAPFVLAQAGTAASRGGEGMVARLCGAALLPYHLGRMLGYAPLGALAGGMAGLVTQMSGLRSRPSALRPSCCRAMARARWRPRRRRPASGPGRRARHRPTTPPASRRCAQPAAIR